MADVASALAQEPGVEPVMFNPLRFGGNAIRSAVAAALALPGRALTAAGDLQRHGDVYDPAPAVDAAMMMAGARFPTVKPGELGTFGGRMSPAADLPALARAEEMAGKGAARETIWDQTGWYQGADGKWRFEIPDNAASIRAIGVHTLGRDRQQPMVNLIDHDRLYDAYPSLRKIQTTATSGSRGTYRPLVSESDSAIMEGLGQSRQPVSEGIEINPNTSTPIKSIVLHELQHAIQSREGFLPGASPSNFIYQNNPLFKYRSSIETPEAAYRRVAGEVEARNVQSRMDMTPAERRARPPWATEDVPRGQQIVDLLSGVK